MNKKLLILFCFFALLVVFPGTVIYLKKKSSQVINGMVFEVSVPKNTLENDTVHIFFQNQKNYKMKKVGDFKYQLEITEEQADIKEGVEIKYRYSRNGYNFRTAEYLEPDTDNYFWTEKGRSATYRKKTIQRD